MEAPLPEVQQSIERELSEKYATQSNSGFGDGNALDEH
jgi:hypothetical protein